MESSKQSLPQLRVSHLKPAAASSPSLLVSIQEVDESATGMINPGRERKLFRKPMLRFSSLFTKPPSATTDSEPPKAIAAPAVLRKQLPPAPPAKSQSPLQPRPAPPTSRRSQSAAPHAPNRLHKRPESPNTNHNKPLPDFPQNGGSSPKGLGDTRGRRGSASALPSAGKNAAHARTVSSPLNMISSTVDNHTAVKVKKRSSWIGGGSRSRSRSRSRHGSQDLGKGNKLSAWINTQSGPFDYSLQYLLHEKVPELWDDKANVYVYLFPETSARSAVFKVPSVIFESSPLLSHLISAQISDGRGRDLRNFSLDSLSLSPSDVSRATSSDGLTGGVQSTTDVSTDFHLNFPIDLSPSADISPLPSDVLNLIEVRNLFAFLTGQPLVSTPEMPTQFYALLAVSKLLTRCGFTNQDNTNFGQAVSESFNFCIYESNLADLRKSTTKLVEALVLGECMKSPELYAEAFAHAVGKYDEVKAVSPQLWSLVSSITKGKMEKANMDLSVRLRTAEEYLSNFDFPSVFARSAASTSSDESKVIKYNTWKLSFMALRKEVLTYLKHQYGHWPPKASSKKNTFVDGGLNRLVLKTLYKDMCDLYDLLVDRYSLTTRPNKEPRSVSIVSALRTILEEHDESSPPVSPPIPFDIPVMPTMTTVEPFYSKLNEAQQISSSTRKLKHNEIILTLEKSHNTFGGHSPFIEKFLDFERREGKNKNCQELMNQRIGHWIFLYTVIQSLPLLVIDAPGVSHGAGVEYFLCMPVLNNMPWIEVPAKQDWFKVQNSGYVSMPEDNLIHGTEGVYRRSHCWLMAEKWVSGDDSDTSHSLDATANGADVFSPLAAPPGFGDEFAPPPSAGTPAAITPALSLPRASVTMSNIDQSQRRVSRQEQRKSIAFGLERLPIPAGSTPLTSRPVSRDGAGEFYGNGDSERRVSVNSPRSPNPTLSSSRVNSPASGTSGKSTFDDILSSMPSSQPEPKTKKRSFF